MLSGEIGLLSLFDLGQLFQLNGATGELSVTRDGRRGYLYFDRGQIVNAVDDEFHEGEGAAYRLFTWKSGTFEFRAQAAPGTRTVTESTEALMLEAARRMDELGQGEAGEEAKLKQRSGAFDALREAFQSVALETGGERLAREVSSDSPLALLAGDDDVLLLRPGRRARVRAGGRWSDADTPPLIACAWDQLRSHLEGPVATAATDRSRTWVATGEDGRRYAVARLADEHESLWVRLANLDPPSLKGLPGGDAIAVQLAGSTGLLVVGAPDPEAADRFFHSCVSHLVATRGETLLLVAETAHWTPGDGAGAVVRTGARDAEAVRCSCSPGIAAFDPAHAGLAASALGAVPLVVAAVVAPDSEAVLPAWRARARGGDVEALDTLLDRLGVSVLFASATDSAARLVLSRIDPGTTSFASRPRTKRAA